MKSLRFFAVLLLFVTGYLFAQPQDSTSQTKTNSNRDSKAALALPQDSVAAKDAAKTGDGSPGLYTALKDPNWWLVVIAFFTGVTIFIQAREMKRATEAMKENTDVVRKGILLQEATMKQWVIFQNWRHQRRITKDGSKLLTIQFEIVNPTDWGMTLLMTKLQVGGVEQVAAHNIPLPPNIPYGLDISCIPLDDKLYLTGGPGVTHVIFGEITLRDCLERIQPYPFSGLFWCASSNPEATFRLQWFAENPYGQQQKQDGQREKNKIAEAAS